MYLERPNLFHKEQYKEMMNEWGEHGGRLHPAALNNNGG
jgi:predicted acetyltransferase